MNKNQEVKEVKEIKVELPKKRFPTKEEINELLKSKRENQNNSEQS